MANGSWPVGDLVAARAVAQRVGAPRIGYEAAITVAQPLECFACGDHGRAS
jgi:hypothetical protein